MENSEEMIWMVEGGEQQEPFVICIIGNPPQSLTSGIYFPLSPLIFLSDPLD